ncbi:DUF4253 domain-containing protein [Leptolyngbya sp. AN03gr2]|uniref:DUF4253 domain-containing protein n=1 Tax=unclassified Leptolyngbya TaxID=2650499 RepID=UPI003D316A43
MLETTAIRLAQITKVAVRDFATYDFGREQESSARSAIVAKSQSRVMLRKLRSELSSGVIAFLGTTHLPQKPKRKIFQELVVAPGVDQFDCLRVAKSDAINFGMRTDDLIARLMRYHSDYGIDIFHAESDAVSFRLLTLPSPLTAFCCDLWEFCPQGWEKTDKALSDLANRIEQNQDIELWWD